MQEGGIDLAAVYFRGEGVYHAMRGRAADAGTPDLTEAWLEWSGRHDVPLLLCSADSQRRLDYVESGGFREAGLSEVFELMAGCDRVVTF
jgi:sulfur relay (sulfurtransferase) complex TusBCD TusD component (DsrE family)